MAIAFIVLHYQTIEDTRACVQSVIDNIDNENYLIVVVDNNSPNGSGEILKYEYINNDMVHVVSSSENLGFARGHNLGIKYARSVQKFKFVILLNNDTEIIGSNWCEVIENKYKKYGFHLLGPDIIDLDGLNHSNPVKRQIVDLADLEKLIKQKKWRLFSNYLFIDSTIRNMKAFIKNKINYQTKMQKKVTQDMFDVQLQGSCFILSELFFQKHEGLFEGTFLYFEEAILRYICDRDNMSMIYTPEITLLHKESSSTKHDYKNLRAKNIFYLKNSLNSCLVLFKMMKNDLESR